MLFRSFGHKLHSMTLEDRDIAPEWYGALWCFYDESGHKLFKGLNRKGTHFFCFAQPLWAFIKSLLFCLLLSLYFAVHVTTEVHTYLLLLLFFLSSLSGLCLLLWSFLFMHTKNLFKRRRKKNTFPCQKIISTHETRDSIGIEVITLFVCVTGK